MTEKSLHSASCRLALTKTVTREGEEGSHSG